MDHAMTARTENAEISELRLDRFLLITECTKVMDLKSAVGEPAIGSVIISAGFTEKPALVISTEPLFLLPR